MPGFVGARAGDSMHIEAISFSTSSKPADALADATCAWSTENPVAGLPIDPRRASFPRLRAWILIAAFSLASSLLAICSHKESSPSVVPRYGATSLTANRRKVRHAAECRVSFTKHASRHIPGCDPV